MKGGPPANPQYIELADGDMPPFHLEIPWVLGTGALLLGTSTRLEGPGARWDTVQIMRPGQPDRRLWIPVGQDVPLLLGALLTLGLASLSDLQGCTFASVWTGGPVGLLDSSTGKPRTTAASKR